MIWLLATLALGADLDQYPWSAPVDTSSCEVCAQGEGAVRVHIPPLLRSEADPQEGTDLLLVDANGQPIPVAWARGRGEASAEPLPVSLTPDPEVFELGPLDRPVQGLEVELPTTPSAATVQAEVQEEDGTWVAHGEPTLVWRNEDEAQTTVVFPATPGPLRLRLQHHRLQPDAVPTVQALRWPVPSLLPDTLEIPVRSTTLHESGDVSYVFKLPHALPLTQVEPVVEEPLFSRLARLASLDEAREDHLYHTLYTLRRSTIGGATLEETTLPWPTGLTEREVALIVDTQGGAPLTIPRVRLELEREEAVVLDPPPGPWTVYGGAPPGTSPVYDLRVAAPELFREAQEVLEPGPVVDNPDYQPPEVRGGIARPGTELDLRGFRYQAPVQAEPGLVSIALPAEVLAHAAPDLSDLRLIDDQGRQIPYVHRQRVADHTWTELEVVREEDGDTSNLRVRVPQPEVPVAGITLHTEATLFSRTVTLARARGAELETLRVMSWSGQGHPSTLRLDLGAVVGEQLLVQIHNGDDPPLPVEVVSLEWPAHELLAWIPEGGARLVYGQPDLGPPDYDLSLLERELRHREAPEAGLGTPETLEPPAPSLLDRIVLLAGLAVLVLGLLVLTLSLLRKLPETPEEE